MKSFVFNKKFLFSAAVSGLFAVAAIFVLINMTGKVKRSVTIEAGSSVPGAEAFLNGSETEGSFITDISGIDTSKPGKEKIELEIDGKKHTSTLIIIDTVPPKGSPFEQYIFLGNELKAENLISGIEDATAVVCSFVLPPDLTRAGWQECSVVLTDGGGNTLTVDSKFYVFETREKISIEAGSADKAPEARDFISNYVEAPGLTAEFLSGLDFSSAGEVDVTLKSGDFTGHSILNITDTVPPKGSPVERYIFMGNEITAENLVTGIEDATAVVCSFVSPPDLTLAGWQDSSVILTDGGGNTLKIDSKFYIYELNSKITLEANSSAKTPSETDFIPNYIESGDFSMEFAEELNFSSVGTIDVILKSGDFTANSMISVEDTLPPEAKPIERFIFMGNTLEAGDLVSGIKDATSVTCSFSSLPDLTKAGRQKAEIILTDAGGNTAAVASGFYILEVKEEVTAEAGSAAQNLTEKDFLQNYTEIPGIYVYILDSGIDFSVPGAYDIILKSGKFTGSSVLKITDTTPPLAAPQNQWTYKGKSIPAGRFVKNIRDASEVTAVYKYTPDFSAEGIQTVQIVLKDTYGNVSEYSAHLTIVVDNEAPKINGNINKSVIAGGTISYKSGVTVTDNYDSNVTLTVDSSKVNLKKAGSYTVVYSAADESGNKTSVNGTVTVSNIDMDLVNGMADDILASITTKEMSDLKKARAIYDWVHNKMSYRADSSVRDIAQRAYNCFTKGVGDCYTYMAASQVLLTRAGIKNTEVKRHGGATPHYWNLVDTGSGWYHFDVCPTPSNLVTISERFMFTQTQAEKFTQRIGRSYYIYDKSTVPEAAAK